MTRNNLTWWSLSFSRQVSRLSACDGKFSWILWSKSVSLCINLQDNIRNRCMFDLPLFPLYVLPSYIKRCSLICESLCIVFVGVLCIQRMALLAQSHTKFSSIYFFQTGIVEVSTMYRLCWWTFEGFSEPLFVRNVHTQGKWVYKRLIGREGLIV